MKHRKHRLLVAGVAARDYMLKHEEFRKPPFAFHAKRLDASCRAIEELLTPLRLSHQRTDRVQIRAMRTELRKKYLIPASRISRRLGRHLAGLQDAYRAPHARASLDDLMAGAERMVAAARPHASFLIEMGVPRDFIAQITSRVERLRRVAAERRERAEDRAPKKEIIERELQVIRDTIDVVDALCDAHLGDGALTDGFRRRSRVGKKVGRKSSRGRRKRPPPANQATT